MKKKFCYVYEQTHVLLKKLAKTIVPLIIITLLAIPSVSYSCVSVFGVTSWSYIDSHAIIAYSGGRAVALIKVSYCYVNQSSRIIFTKDYLCTFDKIIIDGEACDITEITQL